MWQIEFYTDTRDKSPVTEYIDKLTKEEQAKIRNELRLLAEFGHELGHATCPNDKGQTLGVTTW